MNAINSNYFINSTNVNNTMKIHNSGSEISNISLSDLKIDIKILYKKIVNLNGIEIIQVWKKQDIINIPYFNRFDYLKIISIDFSGNTNVNLSNLIEINNCKSLENLDLNLSNCEINDEGIITLMELKKCTSLIKIKLDLSYNIFNYFAMKNLSEFNICEIEYIINSTYSNNEIEQGYIFLTDMFCINNNLISLSLTLCIRHDSSVSILNEIGKKIPDRKIENLELKLYYSNYNYNYNYIKFPTIENSSIKNLFIHSKIDVDYDYLLEKIILKSDLDNKINFKELNFIINKIEKKDKKDYYQNELIQLLEIKNDNYNKTISVENDPTKCGLINFFYNYINTYTNLETIRITYRCIKLNVNIFTHLLKLKNLFLNYSYCNIQDKDLIDFFCITNIINLQFLSINLSYNNIKNIRVLLKKLMEHKTLKKIELNFSKNNIVDNYKEILNMFICKTGIKIDIIL
jgi:hypothetical protein